MTAFIIGNGPSRQGYDLNRLDGVIFGCNALYRDFSPDYLVSTDKSMQNEILEAKYPGKKLFKVSGRPGRTNPHANDPTIETWTKNISHPNNSGVAAVQFALKKGFREIILIGMDLKSEKGYTNVYADTRNYSNQNNKPPKIRRDVLDVLEMLITKNAEVVDWYRVVDENCWIPKFKGLNHISFEELKRWETKEQ